jgi:hypothetical protein
MSASELDGQYRVSTVSNYDGPLERKRDGVTEVQNSQTYRVDDNNVKWTSTFEIMNENQVKMTSLADPTDAVSSFALNRPDGSPTRNPVTYESILKYARKGEQIQLSGQIEYGNEIIFLTMRKVIE